MTFDNQNILPESQASNLEQIKETQRQKNFDDILKMIEWLTKQEQIKFVENMSFKDPKFKELYTQLNVYIFWKVMNWWKEINNKPSSTLSLAWKTEIKFLEQNKDFSLFKEVFEEKNINWNKIATLKPDTYSAYLRYNSNKEPLAKALSESEIQKAKQELNESLKASSNMPYAPQNMDASKNFAQNQFDIKVKQIIKKYIPVADNFVKLLNTTDIWKKIFSNTALNTFDEKLKADVNKNIWNKENAPSEVWSKIENDTKKVIWKLAEIQTNLNKEIETFKSFQEWLKQRDYITWEKILYQDIPKKYEWLIKAEIKDYAINVGKDLIINNSPVIQNKKVFNLPLWNWNEVVLDFSELWNTTWKSQEKILKLYEKNFDSVYKDTLISKMAREMTSKKWLIDISGTVIGWVSAALASEWTFWAWIPVATFVFMTVESLYRVWMYEAFDIEWWWQSWFWINLENETNKDIFRKKWFDVVSTALLFSLFKWSWVTQEYLIKHLKSDTFKNIMENSIANYGIKTWVEWAFFTYYIVATNNLQDTIKNWWNKKEILDSFTNIWNMEDLTKLFAYNLWFITAVKSGAKLAEKWAVLAYETKLNREVEKLETKWYTIVDGRFYKWNNEVPVLLIPEFNTFADLNKRLWYLSTDSYRKPENWRGWKGFNTNQVDPNKRYQKLEEYSKEAQTWKISYALSDRTIWETLQISWLQSWKWVWEWLLKKSWFSNDEVSQFKKWELKWEKPNEMKALSEMDKAMEVVYKEYKEWLSKFISWKSLEEAYPNVSKKLLPKLGTIIKHEMLFNPTIKKEVM